VPFHSAEPYLAKLLENGYKVAICEQVEDPKLAKGIVDRKVVKMLTPGVILDTEQLEEKTNNFLACIANYNEIWGIAFADVSTGDLKSSSFSSVEELQNELANLEPREILIPEGSNIYEYLKNLSNDSWNPVFSKKEEYLWDFESCNDLLKNYLSVKTLQSFRLENKPESIISLGVLINYLLSTQMDDMPPLKSPVYYEKKRLLTN